MPPTIHRVPAIVRFGRVPVPHTNEATYALDAAGRRWIAKREADMGAEALLAEALTWRLARVLGVNTPDAAFCDDPDERAWLSQLVPNATHWSAISASRVENIDAAGAMHAVDAIVFNEARHGRNVLLVGPPNGGLALVAIDADEALIGHPDDLWARGDGVPEPRILAHGMPSWRAAAQRAATLAQSLPPAALSDMVAEACEIAREPRVTDLARVLSARCAVAVDLTHRYLDRVEQRL